MDYSSTELRLSGEQMTITINNGYGLTVSAAMDRETRLPECMEAVSRLLNASGYSLVNIKDCMADESERLEVEIANLMIEK